MSIVAWIFLGLLAGWIASRTLNTSGEGVVLDSVIGIIGAMLGGFLFTSFGVAPVTGFNVSSMFVAVAGAVLVLLIYYAVLGRRKLG